jgi:glutamyl-tRNA(Gln) amidotransferase subunit E
MKAGLEVHQQLAVGKLFCACPSELSEVVRGTFVRRLRPASGEDQAVDAATAFQASRGLAYRYEIATSSCLVEADEEPPHPLNPEALDVALTLALLLDARPVDEIEVMRKIVVDGSNTSGFQRTALVAVDGRLDVGGKGHAILSICLEEDAARKGEEASGEITYRLDRLGIPLIEIATGPDIASGAEAREVAEEIGALVRATRRARRGIGTVREDVNVSAEGGHRTEIKGVQELRRIEQYVDREVVRQNALLAVRDALVRRNAPRPATAPRDVTDLLASVDSGPLAATARRGGPVLALVLTGFGGLLRGTEGSEERLGRELADQARSVGLRGLLHSDELPGAGVGGDAVDAIRAALGVGPEDAFVLVTSPDRVRAERALERIAARAGQALDGVPGETRDPLPDGRTRYSRPLPGRDRMYPETDIPPITVTRAQLDRLRAHLPERPAALRDRLVRETGLAAEVVRQLVASGEVPTFETLVGSGRPPARVARLLLHELPALVEATGGGSPFPVTLLDEVLRASDEGRFGKEGIPSVLLELARGAPTVAEAIARARLGGFTADDLAATIERVVDANRALLDERGPAAFSALMGDVMREVRGRRDGKEVAAALRRAIDRRSATTGATRPGS